ncbi:DUF4870 domain-containing protein [Paludifilum halophilum]|uniref:Orotate phosphoribosyltransferase n=1 Tax=Paludifilum halophilum TaxID=1642702 RepID=A0A235BCR9_9BACL|nr:DUF4870 domain-containing protein [Paludifilum halophilum]OYD09869.1 orotate phosphoribosyltransferase [Paludifilum halophilum]
MNQNVPDHPSRTWGMLCHLSAIIGYVLIPLGHLIGPLLIWLLKKDEFVEVDLQGREALNFQITWTIYALISTVLMVILIGFVLIAVVHVSGLILTVIASVKAKDGIPYRYPMTFRFL